MLFHSCNKGFKNLHLNFRDCLVTSDEYSILGVTLPKGYKRSLYSSEGKCEYRFSYKNGSIAYIANDIWSGSILNYENRKSINHSSYSKEKYLDTIRLEGVQSNGLFWREDVVGDYMVGYLDASAEYKDLFEKAFDDILKLN
jgi:hypothetical protein